MTRCSIAISSGQYHFVDEFGWKLQWRAELVSEWWEQRLWIKAGGHKQDGNEPQWS